MQMTSHTFQKVTTWLLAGLLVVLLYRIVRPFLTPLAWAGVISVFVFPLYRWFLRKFESTTVSALLCTLLVALVLVLPVALLTPALVRQAAAFVEWLRADEGFGALRRSLQGLLARWSVDDTWIQAQLEDLARAGGSFLAQQSARIATGLVNFTLGVVVMLMTLYYLLREGPSILQWLKDLSPLGAGHDVMLKECTDMVHVTITSGFLVALIQGGLGGLLLWLLEVPSPLFYAVLMALLAFLPVVGPWLVWGPIALWLLFIGETGRGIALLVLGFLLVSGIDNVLRPLLIAGRSQMNGLLVFISVLGGIHSMGLIGVVAGPLLASIAVGLLRGYRKELLQANVPGSTPAG